MDELISLILSTGTKVIVSEETVLGGVLKRPLVVNYVLASQGVVTETWEYANDAQDRAWGAIKSVNYQLTSQQDADTFEVRKQRRYAETVVNDLITQLKNQNLTDDQKGTLFTIINPVVTLCLAGELRAARSLANTTATTSLYTPARRTWLVNRIQGEIDKL